MTKNTTPVRLQIKTALDTYKMLKSKSLLCEYLRCEYFIDTPDLVIR